MNNAFICAVISVGEQRQPAGWQTRNIHRKPMVLRCHEATTGPMMCAWLVVSTVAIPTTQLKLSIMCTLTATCTKLVMEWQQVHKY